MRMTLAISNENMCLQFTKNVSSFITSDIFVPIQSRVTTKNLLLLSYHIYILHICIYVYTTLTVAFFHVVYKNVDNTAYSMHRRDLAGKVYYNKKIWHTIDIKFYCSKGEIPESWCCI